MKYIRQYAQLHVELKAIESIMKDIENQVYRELVKMPKGQCEVLGVELHTTVKNKRTYAKDVKDILDDLKQKIEEQKKLAEDAGKVKIKGTKTFDAEIPKSSKEAVLSKVPRYAKYFGATE